MAGRGGGRLSQNRLSLGVYGRNIGPGLVLRLAGLAAKKSTLEHVHFEHAQTLKKEQLNQSH